MSNVWYTNKDFPCDVVATSSTALTGLYTIDGIPLTDGMFVLAASQSDSTASGPYIAHASSWDRIISLATGQQFYIASGATYGKSIYELQTTTPIIVGVTTIILGLVVGPTGGPPTGAAGGDLTGTYPNPVLTSTGVTAATYPTTGSIPVLAISAKGRITSASSSTDGSSLTALNASNLSTGTIGTARLPTGILAINIGTGTVDNTEFGYIDGTTGPIQTQIDSKLSAASNKLNPTPTGGGKIVYDNGTGYSETAVGTSGYVLTSNGSAAPTWNPLSSGPTLPISEVNGGTAQDNTTISTGFVTKTGTGSYIGRSLASGNGITIINPAGTTGNPSIAVLYGSATNTAVQGNDVRMLPAPTTAGNLIYDTGTSYTSITAGTTSKVLIGGTLPSFGNVPPAALTSIPGANITGVVPFAVIPTGMVVNTIATGNDVRFPPTPFGPQGKIVYDNAGSYAETAAGTTAQVLIGGTVPVFGNVPSAALTSVPAGNLTGTVPIGTIPTGTSGSTVTIGNDARLNPTPSAVGNLSVDTGTSYSALAPSATAGQILTSAGTGVAPSYSIAPGSAVTIATTNQSSGWASGNYIGPFGVIENSFATSIAIPWVAPCAGQLFRMVVSVQNPTATNTNYLIYMSTSAAPTTYTQVNLINLPSNARTSAGGSIITMGIGDRILVRQQTGSTLTGLGLHITAQFEPFTVV